MKAIISTISLFICVATCLSQPLDSNVTINVCCSIKTKVYFGKWNQLYLTYKIDTFKNILVTSSRGKISSIDKYFHDLNLKANGKILVSAYDTTDGKRVLLARRNFIAKTYIPTKEEIAIKTLSQKVHISIEDFSETRIPLSIVRKAKQFKVTHPYKIKSATIHISRHEVVTFSINSGYFDFPNWTSSGIVITIDNIIVIDSNNKTHKIIGRSFVVIDD